MTLREDFGGDFAGSAFQRIEGEAVIQGKYGRITELPGGGYDVWFIRPDLGPLGEHRMAAIVKNFPEEGRFFRLNGEGWGQGASRDFVLRVASLARIKRKRRMSPEARAAARERLATYRARNEADDSFDTLFSGG